MCVVVLFSQAPPGEAPWPLFTHRFPGPPMSPIIYIARLITLCSSYLISFKNNALRLIPTYFFFNWSNFVSKLLYFSLISGGEGALLDSGRRIKFMSKGLGTST